MLSLKSGRKIAIIDGDKKKCIYLKDDDSGDSEIETTDENKQRMFERFLQLDKKLSHSDITSLKDAYKYGSGEELGKLERKYAEGVKYVEDSLKKHLDYGSGHSLMPIVEEPSYRLYVSGLSGSGKSYFISQFLKHNKVKQEGAGMFLFSPVQDDKAMKSIRNLIHLDLDELEAEMKGKEFEIEDIPPGSIVIFDDIESYGKNVAKKYMGLRDILLERGRHRDISTICVSHNCCNGHATKVSIREAQYWCLFPKFNARDTKMILKTYGGFEKTEIDEIMALKTRWCFIRKSIPKYAVAEHSVIAY
jgi:hypothetical protein